MAVDYEPDPMEEDDYDEDADSDFEGHAPDDEAMSSSSDDEGKDDSAKEKPQKRRKQHVNQTQDALIVELDSGDEATIKEQEKIKRKQRRKGQSLEGDSGNESDGWKARTRAMRQREEIQRKTNRLATSKGSTIDVNKIWEEMNRPGPLPPVRNDLTDDIAPQNTSLNVVISDGGDKENILAKESEEMVTIKRRFKFAGEVHVEEKLVPKDSAEARLWLAQQENRNQPQTAMDGEKQFQRPLRKISRFDPNYSNLSAYKTSWTRNATAPEEFKGPKLNVVEKSKMDWAVHVDAEGLKDELDVHAKAKEGYHSRMEFLRDVEQRKEEEAKAARLKK
jgi:hypothetical protein